MREVCLIRFGEVHLKGLNRPYFLRKLVANIKNAVAGTGGHVWMSDSRIYVSSSSDMSDCLKRVSRVFGVHSVSPAVEMEKDYEAIKKQACVMASELKGTFKVFAKRSDKSFPLNSMEIERDVGGYILDNNPELKVDIHHPQHRVVIEIRDNAYICVKEIPAVGGMPQGTGGKAMLLLSGGIDSPVAGYQIMKRGVQTQAVHFFSHPYTSERAKEKVFALAKLLGDYASGMAVHVVPFTQIQMAIHEKCPEEYGTIITRRFMMRVSEIIARKYGCQALITGESIGQVASQTMEGLICTNQVVSMPVFRPLIGLDKLEIVDLATSIGTYETSILPYEDCCTVFTPRHPCTKPKLPLIEKAESALDIESLVNDAVEHTEEYKTWDI